MIDVILNAWADERVPGADAQAVVIDVLRATSTIASGLAAGAREVRLFPSLDAARAARVGGGPVVLAGEERCRMPAGFDLGNSPREHVTERVGGATVLLATTNGTRAAAKAQQAGVERLFAGCLLNAGATAEALLPEIDRRDTVFICAGTNGELAVEDVIGAGAMLFSILGRSYRTNLPFTDSAWLAYHAFAAVCERLPAALRLGQGGINVIEAGLEDDIDFCARLDVFRAAVRIRVVDGVLVAT